MKALKQNPKEQKMSHQKHFSAKLSRVRAEDRKAAVRSLMKKLGGRFGLKQCRQIYDEINSASLAGSKTVRLLHNAESGEHLFYAKDLRGKGITAFVEALSQKFGSGDNVPDWLAVMAFNEPMEMLLAGDVVRLVEVDALCDFMGWNRAVADAIWRWLLEVSQDPAFESQYEYVPAVRRDEREAA